VGGIEELSVWEGCVGQGEKMAYVWKKGEEKKGKIQEVFFSACQKIPAEKKKKGQEMGKAGPPNAETAKS